MLKALNSMVQPTCLEEKAIHLWNQSSKPYNWPTPTPLPFSKYVPTGKDKLVESTQRALSTNYNAIFTCTASWASFYIDTLAPTLVSDSA